MSNGTIIVTGASRGIGETIVNNLATKGYTVAGLSRSGTCTAGTGYACDLSDEPAITSVVSEIANQGPIIGLVNNAGQYASERSAQLSTADFEQLMRINVTATFMMAREVYPHMTAAGGGLIVNISSFFAGLGVSQHLAYCASKAALEAMTRCLAVEWARDKIRSLAVPPATFIPTSTTTSLSLSLANSYSQTACRCVVLASRRKSARSSVRCLKAT
jgi:NAD(P)-dependent dehydrogenase (short-subunit alcohol dehydrogenase family)